MEVLTLNQFLPIYLVKWVMDPFALKLKTLLADLKCSISIVLTSKPFHHILLCNYVYTLKFCN